MQRFSLLALIYSLAVIAPAYPQEIVIVRPHLSEDVLVNPGMGFMTFQRFNGDALNQGTRWTEGYPISYQDYKGRLDVPGQPLTSLAYFRVYWKYVEPEMGKYQYDMLDRALTTAASRGQTLLLRIAPYGTEADNDVPLWYRQMVGSESSKHLPEPKWRTDPEDPRYAQYFGSMIRALGQHYNGHPDLESVDLAIVGAWGEGAGSQLLSEKTRETLVSSYLEAFPNTPLIMLLTDPKTNLYGLSRREVGWRVDCLGDMGGFSKSWCHMLDAYPEEIISCGMKDAWKRAPVSLEVCWVMQHWKDQGWDIDYIIDQSLKWHISSFNAKSSAVPADWWPQVNRWLKQMGYRLVLRKFTYPSIASPGGKLAFTSWWENRGVAPCHRPFPLALRVQNSTRAEILATRAEIRSWLPGDSLYNDAVFLPANLDPGEYDLSLALLDPYAHKPKVKLANVGTQADGWFPLGKINIAGIPGP